MVEAIGSSAGAGVDAGVGTGVGADVRAGVAAGEVSADALVATIGCGTAGFGGAAGGGGGGNLLMSASSSNASHGGPNPCFNFARAAMMCDSMHLIFLLIVSTKEARWSSGM